MTVTLQPATEAARQIGDFDAIIDARSPAEYAEDHLPGAVNWPVLDDDERCTVGTLYAQSSALEARKVGAAMAARRIASHLERWVLDKPREWRPLVYCWRGGQRSGSLAWFLDQIGFRTTQLQGGYKAFRAIVREDLARLPVTFRWRVVCGRTGSGKTRLLDALAQRGAQVLDLEGLACHRGSILGAVPGVPQPSQKAFDTAVWSRMRAFDPAREVWVESESARIGRLRVPEDLLKCMRTQGRPLRIEMPDDARVELLLEDYDALTRDAEGFCALLEHLVELRGHALVNRWQQLAREGRWAQVFRELMLEHYDPLYDRSMTHSYADLDGAPTCRVADGSPGTLHEVTGRLLSETAG